MKPGLIAAFAALGLCGCAGYGYEYDYDAYAGPRGHYVGPFEGHHPRPVACDLYSAPIEDGYRGPYVSGPDCPR